MTCPRGFECFCLHVPSRAWRKIGLSTEVSGPAPQGIRLAVELVRLSTPQELSLSVSREGQRRWVSNNSDDAEAVGPSTLLEKEKAGGHQESSHPRPGGGMPVTLVGGLDTWSGLFMLRSFEVYKKPHEVSLLPAHKKNIVA